MIKIKNLLIVIVALIITMTGVTGCMGTKNSIKDRMISYMEEKYDDKFTYINSFGGDLDGTSVQILLSSKKMPEKQIAVGYYVLDSREKFTDNYTHLKFEEDVKNYFGNILSTSLSTDVIVSYGVSTTGVENDFSSQTTFEEFLKSPQAKLLLSVVVSPEYEFENKKEQTGEIISQALVEEQVCCDLDIYFVSSKEMFKKREALSFFDLEKESLLCIATDENGKVIEFEWVR